MFQQTSGTVYPAKNRAGSVCICSAWSRAGKRGEGCGLRCHPNFSKVFPSSAPLQGITQSLTGCLMPGGEGMAFGLCVLLVLAAVSGPGLTSGCAVRGHLCDKSRAGPQQRRGERANVSHILPVRVRSQPATSAHRLSPQPSCFWGEQEGTKGCVSQVGHILPDWHEDGAHQLSFAAQLHPQAPFPTRSVGFVCKAERQSPALGAAVAMG